MAFPASTHAERHPVRVLGAEEFGRRIAAGQSAEGMARMAAATKARWNVPAYRARQAQPKRRTPEHQAKLDAHTAALMQRPEVRARMVEGHAHAIEERRRRQEAILAAAERELGLSPACRDVALLRLLLADWGLFRASLAAYLGLPSTTLRNWVAGVSRPAAGAPVAG